MNSIETQVKDKLDELFYQIYELHQIEEQQTRLNDSDIIKLAADLDIAIQEIKDDILGLDPTDQDVIHIKTTIQEAEKLKSALMQKVSHLH